MRSNKYPSLSGKTVAVSGSTGGIGKELCRSLAGLGASLLLLDRNPEKADRLIGELCLEYPDLSVKHIRLDLEDTDNLNNTIDELKSSPPHILILNAGAYHIPRRQCKSGHDNIFQINFLSPYILASELLPHLERLVVVGSLAHASARFDPNDPEYLTRRAASRVYGNAKRMLTFSLFELCRGRDILSVAHPGISPTGITRGYPKVIRAIIKYPMKLIFMSPKKASDCILRGVFALTDIGEWIGPRLFGIWGKPRVSRLKSYSEKEAREIYRYTKENT